MVMGRDENQDKLPANPKPDEYNSNTENDRCKNEVNNTEFVIERMLYILGGYILAPSPLPTHAIKQWTSEEIDKTLLCEYCSLNTSKIAFPQVSVELFDRKILLRSTKRACECCYDVINLKKIKTIVKDALLGNTEELEKVHSHFAKINDLRNEEKTFQELLSMATSLNLILKTFRSRTADVVENVSASIQPLTDSDHFVSILRAITNGKGISSSFIRNIEPLLLEKLPDFSLKNIYDVVSLLKSAKSVPVDIIDVLLKSVHKEMEITISELPQAKLAIENCLEIIDLYKDRNKTAIKVCLSYLGRHIEYCSLSQLFRIARIYKSFIEYTEIRQVEKLTSQVLLCNPLDLFSTGPFKLTHCSILVSLLELISLNLLLNTSCQFNSHICSRGYVTKVLYPLIEENVRVFTADHITKIVEYIGIIGEPYPTDLLNSISRIYIRHMSQYSFKNMMCLMGNLTKMKFRDDNLLISTLSFLPRKIQSIDSVEGVILLLDNYFESNYVSDYFNIFISQQILQLSHKIGKRHYQELTEKLNRTLRSIPENGKIYNESIEKGINDKLI